MRSREKLLQNQLQDLGATHIHCAVRLCQSVRVCALGVGQRLAHAIKLSFLGFVALKATAFGQRLQKRDLLGVRGCEGGVNQRTVRGDCWRDGQNAGDQDLRLCSC